MGVRDVQDTRRIAVTQDEAQSLRHDGLLACGAEGHPLRRKVVNHIREYLPAHLVTSSLGYSRASLHEGTAYI